MPFKSKAQRRKFAQLLVEGKITDGQYEEWNRSTGGKALPERVGAKKASAARKTARKTAPARKAAKKTRAAKGTASKATRKGSARRKRTTTPK